ncbi:MAG: type II secretion system protein [Desulfosporosinus sp.]|nr:type II secretion system protein [Desulfosporosinus sp.]
MTNVKVLKNKKGFTLIELIVVMAILAILAAIAIPKFSGMRIDAAVNADASTASQIVNAARIQETQTGTPVVAGTVTATNILPAYMAVPLSSQTGGAFTIGGGGTTAYVVTFVPGTSYGAHSGVTQTVTENVKFSIDH